MAKPETASAEVYKKAATLKERIRLSNDISIFCRYKLPTYVRFKLLQFQSSFQSDVETFSKVNEALIDRLSPKKALAKYNEDNTVNPAWDSYKSEIAKIEDETKEITFKKLPLSMVFNLTEEGGFPHELFYEDPACAGLLEKLTKGE